MASADKWMMVLLRYDHSIPNFLPICLKNFWSLRNWLLNASFKLQYEIIIIMTGRIRANIASLTSYLTCRYRKWSARQGGLESYEHPYSLTRLILRSLCIWMWVSSHSRILQVGCIHSYHNRTDCKCAQITLISNNNDPWLRSCIDYHILVSDWAKLPYSA